MKKILFIVMFFLSLIVLVSQTNAQCPTGYTPRQINMIVNDCPYQVDLCVKCSVLGMLFESVNVTGFMQIPLVDPCIQTLTAKEVLKYIELYVLSPDYYYTHLCENPQGVPPCPGQSQEIEVKYWSCWKVELVEYFGMQALYYRICGDAYCIERDTYCFDPVTNENKKTKTYGPLQVGVPSCSIEPDEVTFPTQVGQISDCFILHNACY